MEESNSRTGRLIAIGDIHGHATALESILDAIIPGPDDTIVTLGDYVNRGPDSRTVLELLIDLSHRCNLIPILGNHEEMMLDSRDDPHAELRWKSQGGDATLASYGPDAGIGDIPQDHWNFLLSCRPFYETDQYVFTHGGYCWYSQFEDQPSSLLRWISLEESPPRAHLSGKKFVLGHTPGSIRDFGFCLCIDTGCGFGGKLTAFEMNTGYIWQVDGHGNQSVPQLTIV